MTAARDETLLSVPLWALELAVDLANLTEDQTDDEREAVELLAEAIQEA